MERPGRHRAPGPPNHEGPAGADAGVRHVRGGRRDPREAGADAARAPADATFSDETEQLLPELFGGLSLALARAFRSVDPEVVNPSTQHWDRVTDLFRQVF
ncbi:DUF1931 family protein [Blastococcus brunescens]|uniref:DUF1931 family protein n=1 Tax=Blastococcus brunescens TaxID=1564165 RepID=A0ABZ1ATE4_9ACTN|nr:DUF1931 family protein [Blastococcus sp. BMG 8361]WRL61842.1 DUF1931 family protein [Blastococcus sp. BMG 8361]